MSIDSLLAFLDAGHLQPLHEGTIRYLKEKGHWSEAYQIRQDALVALAQERVALFKAALAAARAEGLKPSPENEGWVAFWQEYCRTHAGEAPYGARVMALPPA
jgi:hypothetical protein